MLRIVGFLFAVVVAICLGGMRGPDAALAASSCVAVIDSADPATDDTAMESICVDGNMNASFGEDQPYFGDIVKTCGKVSAKSTADAVIFTVDLSACEDLPTHTIICPPVLSGKENHCTLIFASDQSQRAVTLMMVAK